MIWAKWLKRACSPKVGALGDVDVETCRVCGGAVKVITCIEDPVGLLMSVYYYLNQKDI